MRELKRFLYAIILMVFSTTLSNAETITLKWLNNDGNAVSSTTTCESGGDVILPATPTKYGYTFQGWKLKQITPVEYLESTGTQYISLNIGENGQAKILETEIEYTAMLQYSIIVGITDNNRMTAIQVETAQNNVWSVYLFGSLYLTSIPAQTNTKYKLKVHYESGNTNFYINNSLIKSFSNPGTVGNKFTFFANYSTNTFKYGNFSAAKIYNVKISDLNGNILAELIPVLDYIGIPCMYDKVSGQFFYNDGTGDFVAGPVISE